MTAPQIKSITDSRVCLPTRKQWQSGVLSLDQYLISVSKTQTTTKTHAARPIKTATKQPNLDKADCATHSLSIGGSSALLVPGNSELVVTTILAKRLYASSLQVQTLHLETSEHSTTHRLNTASCEVGMRIRDLRASTSNAFSRTKVLRELLSLRSFLEGWNLPDKRRDYLDKELPTCMIFRE